MLTGARAHAPELRRFAAFLVVGLLNTVVGYLLFALLSLAGLAPTKAVIGATILGALFNFQSIGRLVFGQGGRRLLPRFLAVYAGQCALNILALRALATIGLPPLVAEALVLPPLAVLTYLAMRQFVFGARP
jgi:putative flippase GtrA